MGARTQEAVSFRSKQNDAHLLRLLGILAAGANDETGLIDPAPNRETLADITNCTSRTITNRIAKLIESGELEQVRMGSGPGNPSAYRILLEIPEVTCFKDPDDYEQKGEKGENLGQKVDRLEQEMAELKALFFTLLEQKGESEKAKGGKVERQRVKGGKAKGESLPEVDSRLSSYDPLFDPEDDPREGISPPPPLFTGEWFQQNGIPAPDNDEERALIGHPATRLWISLTDRWPTYSGLRQIAKRLGPAPDTTALQEAWDLWKASEYKLNNVGGILDRYDAAKNRVNPGTNGKHPPKDATTELLLARLKAAESEQHG